MVRVAPSLAQMHGLRPRTASRQARPLVLRTAHERARLIRRTNVSQRRDFSSTRCRMLRVWYVASLLAAQQRALTAFVVGVDGRRPTRRSDCGWSISRVRWCVAHGSTRPRGADTATAAGLLPRGPAQLVEHFTTICDQAFVELLDRKQEDFAGASAVALAC